MSKNEMNSKPRRAQGGMGLLSRSISVQNPQESIPLIPREEREEEERGEGEGRQGGEVAPLFLRQGKGKTGSVRGRGGERVFNPNNSQPKRLNYP